jgi:hypothetical protein
MIAPAVPLTVAAVVPRVKADRVGAVGAQHQLARRVAELRELVGAAHEPGLRADAGAEVVDDVEPGAGAEDELLEPGGRVVREHAVDAVGEVAGGEVGEAFALADGAAFGEGNVQEVDGLAVLDGVGLVAQVQAEAEVLEVERAVAAGVGGRHQSSPCQLRTVINGECWRLRVS